jgi:hypothetical protein
MDSDVVQFIGEIWQYKPMLIVLLAVGLIVFVLSVIDTHRHRKKTQRLRHPPKKH